MPNSSIDVFLIGSDRFFDRPGIYVDPATAKDYPDQADRWIFFQRAVMEFLKNAVPSPDILHCHDHQTGLIPAYLRRRRVAVGHGGGRPGAAAPPGARPR